MLVLHFFPHSPRAVVDAPLTLRRGTLHSFFFLRLPLLPTLLYLFAKIFFRLSSTRARPSPPYCPSLSLSYSLVYYARGGSGPRGLWHGRQILLGHGRRRREPHRAIFAARWLNGIRAELSYVFFPPPPPSLLPFSRRGDYHFSPSSRRRAITKLAARSRSSWRGERTCARLRYSCARRLKNHRALGVSVLDAHRVQAADASFCTRRSIIVCSATTKVRGRR